MKNIYQIMIQKENDFIEIVNYLRMQPILAFE